MPFKFNYKHPVVPILISILALFISGEILYNTHLKPAELDVFPSESIAFGYNPSKEIRITVPCVFVNNGAKDGIIQNLGIIIKNPDNDFDTIFIRWTYFLTMKVLEEGRIFWDIKNRAFPISVSPGTSPSEIIEFKGNDLDESWIPEPKKYDFYIVAWEEKRLIPSIIKKISITFDKDGCADLKDKHDKGLAHSIWVLQDEWGKWKNKVLSPTELKELLTNY